MDGFRGQQAKELEAAKQEQHAPAAVQVPYTLHPKLTWHNAFVN